MRIAIVGAGLSGVCTAYELAAAGHEVVVFERRGSVAAEASFAPSALLAPALALPGLLPAPAGSGLRWLWARRCARRSPAQAQRESQALQLARLGHKRLCALRRALAIDDEAGDGVLMLLREAKQHASLQPRLERLAAAGLAVQAIDAQACLAREPGLNPDAPLHGGLLLGRSSVGNGRLFAQHLRAHAQRLGASFRFHHTVQRVQAKSRGVQVSHVESDASPATRMDGGDAPARPAGPQTESFDAVVLCASLGAAELLRSIWPTLRLATVADATLTLQRRVMEAYPDLGPKAGLVDAKDGVTMARIGQRLRVTGRIGPAHHVRLHATLQHWFPGSVLQSQVQASTRRRLLMPDGLPVLGPSGQPGVWLHLSQGGEAGQGWSAACGAARVLADAISGVTPEVDTSALIVPRPS